MKITPIGKQYPNFGAKNNVGLNTINRSIKHFRDTLNTPIEDSFVRQPKKKFRIKELESMWREEVGLPPKQTMQTNGFLKLIDKFKSFIK